MRIEIVDTGDDLRLLRYGGVERRTPGGGERAPEMCNSRVFEQAVDRGDVTRDLGVIFLGIADEQGRGG
jgi:hypothetical protein